MKIFLRADDALSKTFQIYEHSPLNAECRVKKEGTLKVNQIMV